MEGMEAALNASLERKTTLHAERTRKEQVLELGNNLQRLMVGLTSDVGALRLEVDEGDCTHPQCMDAINSLHDTKIALLRTYAEWQRTHGPKADASVGSTVANLEVTTNRLIDDLKDRLDQLQPPRDVRKKSSTIVRGSQAVTTVVSDVFTLTRTLEEVAISGNNEDTGSRRMVAISTASPNPLEKSGNVEQPAIPTTGDISGGQKGVAKTTIPATDPISQQKIQETGEKSEKRTYGTLLTALKSKKPASRKGTKGSKASTANSKASKAALLQVRLEEAEAKIEEDYNKELSERALRVATRNAKREQERILEKLADEKAERESKLNKKKASIKAKHDIIESFREENSILSKSIKSESKSGIPEILPMDKAAAYVADVFKHKNSSKLKPKKGKLKTRAIASEKNAQYTELPQTIEPLISNSPPKSFQNSKSKRGPSHRPSDIQALPIYTTPATNYHYAWATRESQTAPMQRFRNEPEISKSRQISTPIGGGNANSVEIGQCEPSPPGQSEIQRSPLEHSHGRFAQSIPIESENTDRIIGAVRGEMSLGRLPVLQPEVFDGKDPLSFPIWRMAFDAMTSHKTMTDIDKMNLLNHYVGGEAKVAIRGYLLMEPKEAFSKAYSLLVKRYGDNCKLANAFKDRLRAWTKIGGTDMDGLRVFVDFLKQCETAKRSYRALRTLDDESENAEICKKLPVWLTRKWTNKVSGHREATGEFPPFCEFVEFLTGEEIMANDPLARVLRKAESGRERTRGGSFASESRSIPNGSAFGNCAFCKGQHSIDICKKFKTEIFEEKRRFMREIGLCFRCLMTGHIARHCRNTMRCQICQGIHPTSMHREDSPPEGVTGNSNFANTDSIGYSHRIMVNPAQNPQGRGKRQRARNRVNSPLGW